MSDTCSEKVVEGSESIATVYSAALDWDPLLVSSRLAQEKVVNKALAG